jgi:N-acyl-D-aspartate/D-glutamate deacylase
LKRISRRISDEKGSLSGCLREPIGHLPCRSNASRKRVALVTGSSSGIGRGLAIAVAREGVKVVVNYPDDSQAANARAVVAEIERLGGRALSVRADVSVEDEARSIVEATMTTFQRIVKQTLPGRLETRSSPRAITRRAGEGQPATHDAPSGTRSRRSAEG